MWILIQRSFAQDYEYVTVYTLLSQKVSKQAAPCDGDDGWGAARDDWPAEDRWAKQLTRNKQDSVDLIKF